MSRFMGNEWAERGNYVPHPRPKYAPDGHHRCESCNAIVRDGDECGCKERESAKRDQDVRVHNGKYNWHDFVDPETRRRRWRNGSKKH